MVSRRSGRVGRASLRAPVAPARDHAASGEFPYVLRARHAKLDAAPATAASAVVLAALCARAARRACLCESVSAASRGERQRASLSHRARQFLQHAGRHAVRGCEAAGARIAGGETALTEGADHGARRTTRGADAADCRRDTAPRGAGEHPAGRWSCELRRRGARHPNAERDGAFARRPEPLQRYAAHRHAGELRRPRAAGQCHPRPASRGHGRGAAELDRRKR